MQRIISAETVRLKRKLMREGYSEATSSQIALRVEELVAKHRAERVQTSAKESE
jgi:hypothetical protein